MSNEKPKRGRPKKPLGQMVTTSVRLPRSLHTRLANAAEERDLSAGWVMRRAIENYLDRLIPVDEVHWIRERGSDEQ